MTDRRHTEELSLAELAELGDVTPRTVRYYISNGLLPGPTSRGPKAAYTVGHLDRLRLIKHLQEQYLPLAEIRRVLEGLDDDGVRRSLAESVEREAERPSSALEYIRRLREDRGTEGAGAAFGVAASGSPAHRVPPAAPSPSRPGPAAEDRGSSRQSGPASEDRGSSRTPEREKERSTPRRRRRRRPTRSVPSAFHTEYLIEEDIAPAGTQESGSGWAAERSRWDRIALTPDVELHVRRPLSPRDQRAVRDLIEEARRLFEEGSP